MGLTTGLCQHNMIVVVIGVILGPGVSWGFQSTETCDQKHLHFHWVKIVLGQNRIGSKSYWAWLGCTSRLVQHTGGHLTVLP